METQTQDLTAELQRLRDENARLRAGTKTSGGLRVSPKGAVSLYGLGRFPITLYREQWESVLARASAIRAFIAANDARIARKAPAEGEGDNGE